MGKIIVTSVGFDVGLVLRSVLKVSVGPGDTLFIVYSLTGDEFSRKRVSEAVSTIKELLRGSGIDVVDCEVTGVDFYEDVLRVLRDLEKYSNVDIIASLVGGMRMTLFAIVFALELMCRMRGGRATLYLMREDGLYDVMIKLPLVPMLGTSERKVLKLIKELNLVELRRGVVVGKLSSALGVSEAAVRKILKSLEKKGVISVSNGLIRLEKLGEILCELIG
ncbi:MAG: hypothetical protein QW047_05315 [Sulfolobales archaeon]